jgi:signal transduction histidine kinase
VPGHGIGLSMVQDTVELYGGNMTIGASPTLAGASFEIRLPGR